MLSRSFKAAVAGIVVAAGIAALAAPAEAQSRRHYRGNQGAAIGAGIALGIIGLGAAAIAADQRRQAYDDGYYYAPRYRSYGGPAYYEAPPRVYYQAPPRVYYREAPHRGYRRAPAVDDRYPHTFRHYQ
ncbi:MAG: hypothetical protein Q8O26_01780 [Phreatobacter sp.]|uniref:hypothetical protein n=1 Tax=Phreatobacter sp. TaxID=1966341 RepID=UPI0027369DDD|nr:hypothetical protein [Phreatobacter sp.]MDP2800589.1 hypothetical protein [Phreatobacter sp.]